MSVSVSILHLYDATSQRLSLLRCIHHKQLHNKNRLCKITDVAELVSVSDVTAVKISICRMRISTFKICQIGMRIEAFILSVGT